MDRRFGTDFLKGDELSKPIDFFNKIALLYVGDDSSDFFRVFIYSRFRARASLNIIQSTGQLQ